MEQNSNSNPYYKNDFANRFTIYPEGKYENHATNELLLNKLAEFETEVKIDVGGYPYIPVIELYDYEKDIPLAKVGDKVKVLIFKEE